MPLCALRAPDGRVQDAGVLVLGTLSPSTNLVLTLNPKRGRVQDVGVSGNYPKPLNPKHGRVQDVGALGVLLVLQL